MYVLPSKTHYQLEPYKGLNSRFTCPSCGKAKQFTKYIDSNTFEYIADSVGKCNRIDKCSYHYTPKQYFSDNPHLIECSKNLVHHPNNTALKNGHNALFLKNNNSLFTAKRLKFSPFDPCTSTIEPFDTISQIIYEKSLRHYHLNNFTVGLEKLFSTSIAIELIKRFNIGTAKQPQNGSVFWQVDDLGKVRTGKIMLYDADTLKRAKKSLFMNNQQGIDNKHRDNFIPLVDWVHSRIKRQQQGKEYHLQQCLFGLHQLTTSILQESMAIGIVESEKTAIIASVYMTNLVWMATGGAQNLNSRLLKPLKNHRVILFPDVNQFQLWEAKARQIRQQLEMDITVSDFMELRATKWMKENGADLADVLIKRDKKAGWALTDENYPLSWDICL